jgi:hypothetical protein
MENKRSWVALLQNASSDKTRIKFFLVFLLLSFVFWFFTKFSKEYTEIIELKLRMKNLPTAIIPIGLDHLKIEATLNASGFQFLYYQYFDNFIEVTMENTLFENGLAIYPVGAQLQSIQEQLLGDTKVLNIFPTTLQFDYQVQSSKRVPIQAPDFKMAVGFELTRLDFEPDSLTVIGPKAKLQSINSITPDGSIDFDLNQNITKRVNFTSRDPQIIYSENLAEMTLEVGRYSEKSFVLPIEWKNRSPRKVVKLFPEAVSLSFSASLTQLRSIEASDFQFTVDYTDILENKKTLPIELTKKPSRIKNIRWDPKEVDYLIRE